MIDERWQTVKKVLLVRLDNLGDVLLTTPAFHAVKSALPHASLTLLASNVGAQVAALNPDIDDVIVYSAPWMDPWRKMPQDSEREQRMIAEIKARHFDGAIIFTSFHQSSLPSAYLCYLADIPLRVAASVDGPGSLLTTRHKYPDTIIHEVEHNLDLVRVLGMDTDERDLVLTVPADAKHTIEQLLKIHVGETLAVSQAPQPTSLLNRETARVSPTYSRPLVVVHPGCTMPARTYPWEMYVEVINLLVEQLGAFVIVTGANDEKPLVEQILEQVRPENRSATLAMAGTLPFPMFCALIQAADLTITNNTGPMHISAAVKTPVIALFALTNPPEQWGPWHVVHRQMYHDVSCRICYSRICPYQHECLRLVSPQMVVDASVELLASLQEGAIA
ncbi:MAG: glycosyltransferase family 9 protein [Ktedonobacteraceae bacterium]|nr:glycosyltransferase family 9 protein [Ktedonobacteraceae bacterium]